MARSQNTNQPFPPAPDFVPAVPQDLMDEYDLIASNLTPLLAELRLHLASLKVLDEVSAGTMCGMYARCVDVNEDEFVDQWLATTGARQVWAMLSTVGIDPA